MYLSFKNAAIAAVIMALSSCGQSFKGGMFGEKFEANAPSELSQALQSYESGKDTTYIIQGTIENVCQGEGCWITLKNGNGEFMINTHEKFSMPKNSKGHKAVAKGRFVKNEEGETEFEPSGVLIE